MIHSATPDVPADLFKGKRETIVRQIQTDAHEKLTFNRLKGLVGLEGNELSYHLRILRSSGIIQKDDHSHSYTLTQKGKVLFPYLPIITQQERPALVICSIALVQGEYVFLQKKPREPNKGMLSLIGEKVLDTATVEETAKQILEKTVQENYSDLTLRCVNECIKTDENKIDIVFHDIVYFFTAQLKGKKPERLIRKKRSTLKEEELFWDNWFLIQEMADAPSVRVTTTRF